MGVREDALLAPNLRDGPVDRPSQRSLNRPNSPDRQSLFQALNRGLLLMESGWLASV